MRALPTPHTSTRPPLGIPSTSATACARNPSLAERGTRAPEMGTRARVPLSASPRRAPPPARPRARAQARRPSLRAGAACSRRRFPLLVFETVFKRLLKWPGRALTARHRAGVGNGDPAWSRAVKRRRKGRPAARRRSKRKPAAAATGSAGGAAPKH